MRSDTGELLKLCVGAFDFLRLAGEANVAQEEIATNRLYPLNKGGFVFLETQGEVGLPSDVQIADRGAERRFRNTHMNCSF